jgi:hypothetical protein
MLAVLEKNDVSRLYTLKLESQFPNGPAGPALQHLVDAWLALESLEGNLSDGPDRWQADSIHVAREGIRRAWLAVSNLERGLQRRDRRVERN